MDRRARLVLVAALVAVAALAVGVLVTRGGDGEVAVELADEESTTSTTEPEPGEHESTTTTAPEPAAPTSTTTTAPDRPATTTTTASTPPTTTTPTTPPPPPADEPRCAALNGGDPDRLSVQVCLEGDARAGEPTVIRITASDGDAAVRDDCGSPLVEWGDEGTAVCAIGCEPSPGPHAPSSIDLTRDHEYRAAGTYDIRVTVESNCGQGPFGESQAVTLRVIVR